MTQAIIVAATRFADALDAEDYGALNALLASDCEYVARDGTYRGQDAIQSSYRSAAVWAKTHIASVVYESRVCLESGDTAVVTFIDRLRHAGVAHVYSCEQVLEFAADGAIRRITHRELAGERAALNAFLGQLGFTR